MHVINPYRYSAGGGGFTVLDYVASAPGATPTPVWVAPAGIQAGELLVLIIGGSTGHAAIPGWLSLGQSNGAGTSHSVFYRIADGTETDLTPTVTNAYWFGWFLRCGVPQTPTPWHKVSGSNNTSGVTVTTPEVTTTIDNCLCFFVATYDGADGGSFSLDSGVGWAIEDELFVGTGSGGVSGCWGYKTLETAGASGVVVVRKGLSDGWTSRQFAMAPP